MVEDRSYIKVSGLRIINAGQNDPNSTADDNHAGIYVDNSHHLIIENNYIYNAVSSLSRRFSTPLLALALRDSKSQTRTALHYPVCP